MRQVLFEYYKDTAIANNNNLKGDSGKIRQYIFHNAFANSDDPTSAGQIGNKISSNELNEVIIENGNGNLREKMTAFYNAAYYKGYKYSKEKQAGVFNLKNIVQSIAENNDKKYLINELDLDSSILDECKNISVNANEAGLVGSIYNKGIVHKVIASASNCVRKLNKDFNADEQFSNRMHPRDILDMGLISFNSGSLTQVVDNIKSGSALIYRDEGEQEKMQRTLEYYNEMGLFFSDRETEYIKNAVKQNFLDEQKKIIDSYSNQIDNCKGKEEEKDIQIMMNEILKNLSIKYLAFNVLFNKYVNGENNNIDVDRVFATYAKDNESNILDVANVNENISTSDIKKYKTLKDNMIETYNSFLNSDDLNNQVKRSPIKEGIIYKDVNKDGFLQKIMIDEHSVRIVNGISMTTARMLKCFKWLGFSGDDLLWFRLALMGWMLPTDDHSLWEIIIGSHNIGVKGNEDLTDITTMDETVSPLKIEDLRDHVCEKIKLPNNETQPLFPYEYVRIKNVMEKSEKDLEDNRQETKLISNNDNRTTTPSES